MRQFFKTVVITAGLFCLSSSVSLGEEAVVSGPIRFIGTGCPTSQSEAIVTEDLKTVSLLFSAFKAKSGSAEKKHYEYRSCEIRVPITVTPRYRIKVSNLDYRGYRFLLKNTDWATGSFETRIVSRGVMTSSGVNLISKRGAFQDDFFYEPPRSVSSYGCGGAMELRIRPSIAATSRSCSATPSQADFDIDSIDFSTHAGAGDFEFVRCR